MPENINKISRLWSNISHIGITNQDYSESRRITLSNQVAVFGIIFPQLYNIFYIYYDYRTLVPVIIINIIAPLFCFLVFFLNAFNFYRLAKLVICIVPNIQIFLLTYYLGTDTGMHLLHIMMVSFIFFVLSNENRILAGFILLIPVLLFVFSYYNFLPEHSPIILGQDVLLIFYLSIGITVFFLIIMFFVLFYNEIVYTENLLEKEYVRSEKLLLSILPEKIAVRLKDSNGAIVESYPSVTILFADMVGFTEVASIVSPTRLLTSLNSIFTHIDQLVEQYGLEKIKTIGDAYMVAGGLPVPVDNHTEKMALLALDMINDQSMLEIDGHTVGLRIGFHTGSVVAGVIGKSKFSYDIWGEAVNIASRMESHSSPGKIQVSLAVYEILKDKFNFEACGVKNIKGLQPMQTYFLTGIKK